MTYSEIPLAETLRPRTMEAFVGQDHLLGPGRPLRLMIESGQPHSLILWGPPGCGKTTLAHIIATATGSDLTALSAVSAGVKDVRAVLDEAQRNALLRRRSMLFIDEIHRFNKAQQDALLHGVENGLVTLLGATTENPSFEVISPLLSRCKVYVLQHLDEAALGRILETGRQYLLKNGGTEVALEAPVEFINLSGGDARVLLNSLQIAARLALPDARGLRTITRQVARDTFQKKMVLYDDTGEQHYNIISAFIKSIRGSDPDAAVYWLARMIDGGEDPLFIARRMVVLASEDIGNAEPYAITMATSCFTACSYIGMPEARIVLSQTATYLACAHKSNAAISAVDEALAEVGESGDLPVPLHLRNAPTRMMKDMGYHKGYRYDHSFEGNFSAQQHLPDALRDKIFYHPTENGREKALKERLNALWKDRRR